MHMIEHELIMLVATLAARRVERRRHARLGPAATASPSARRRLEIAAQSAVEAADRAGHRDRVQAVVMWAWHAPALFDRALESPGWHIAQHASFFVSSLLFWWAMLHPRERGSGYGVSAACLFVDLADRRRARRADELLASAPGTPIMRRWA